MGGTASCLRSCSSPLLGIPVVQRLKIRSELVLLCRVNTMTFCAAVSHFKTLCRGSEELHASFPELVACNKAKPTNYEEAFSASQNRPRAYLPSLQNTCNLMPKGPCSRPCFQMPCPRRRGRAALVLRAPLGGRDSLCWLPRSTGRLRRAKTP